jgi:hypothetical protein
VGNFVANLEGARAKLGLTQEQVSEPAALGSSSGFRFETPIGAAAEMKAELKKS